MNNIRFLIGMLLMTTGHLLLAQQAYTRSVLLMGCRFDITVVAQDEVNGNAGIDLAVEEISRIERLISSWDPDSQTSEINRNAGVHPVAVDKELYDLIERALYLSRLTDGAFDISYASMDNIWKFDGTMKAMPAPGEIVRSVALVGYRNIVLDPAGQTVLLRVKGMRIGFGAIGKGYAAERAKALLLDKGVTAGIINASGDLTAWGRQPDGKDWMVAIINPLTKEKAFSWLPVRDGAVVTSGNYEKYVELNGKRYAHIIDPRTGYPCSEMISATVFCRNAEMADALATGIFVMGVDVGLDFVNQLDGVSCILVDDKNQVHTSKDVQLQYTR